MDAFDCLHIAADGARAASTAGTGFDTNAVIGGIQVRGRLAYFCLHVAAPATVADMYGVKSLSR
jgi:hypothetical protein